MFIFFFNDTATTEIYTLSLHDALPICRGGTRGDHGRWLGEAWHGILSRGATGRADRACACDENPGRRKTEGEDRKSTRLNSSHANISYAVFCLKKKKKKNITQSSYHIY